MLFLFSGEGPTDMGRCTNSELEFCTGEDYQHGPMAVVVDKLAEYKMKYSHIDCGLVYFVSRSGLAAEARNPPKKVRMPGQKVKKEQRGYWTHAGAFAVKAGKLMEKHRDIVVGVYFRDSDGTHTSPRTLWEDKISAIEEAFKAKSYHFGVVMMPKPKSEAWLLCAVQKNYQHCEALEHESGNDNSPNPLKKQLAQALGKAADDYVPAQEQLALIERGEVDVSRIEMPSFRRFKQRLEEVLQQAVKSASPTTSSTNR